MAVYLQDRVQPTTRWYVEFGGRLDRDGITNQWNPTPRIGTALLLNSSGSAVLRGGFGVFYERTPSTAGVFNNFENYIDTRYAADGVTPLSTVLVTHLAAPTLQTPRSVTWDVSYNHRLNASWALHAGVVDRTGAYKLVVQPFRTGTGTGQLLLNSTGRSDYREADVGVHFTHSHGIDLNVWYIRSSSHADLNSLTNYFDTLLWPIVGENQYRAIERRAASSVGTRACDADQPLAAARHVRLAERLAVFGGERDARLRGNAQQSPFPQLHANRARHRASLPHLQAAAVGSASAPTTRSRHSCQPTFKPTSRRRPSGASTIPNIASSGFRSDSSGSLLRAPSAFHHEDTKGTKKF